MPEIKNELGRIYGPHKFPDMFSGRMWCEHGCGCWYSLDEKNGGGPLGLDSLMSCCPNNPLNGDKLPGNQDYEIVVSERIHEMVETIKKLVTEKKKLTDFILEHVEVPYNKPLA